jgi:hypothetical protein
VVQPATQTQGGVLKRAILYMVLAALLVLAMSVPAFALPPQGATNYCVHAAIHGAQGGPPGVICL